MPNVWSGASSFLAYLAASPNYADLGPGLIYAIVLQNPGSTDVTTGTVAIEAADAKPDDPCTPDTWAPLPFIPPCDAPAGTNLGNAQIVLSAQQPIRARSQCSFSLPCPRQFLRLTGVPSGLNAIVVVGRLRRTNFDVGTVSGHIESIKCNETVAA